MRSESIRISTKGHFQVTCRKTDIWALTCRRVFLESQSLKDVFIQGWDNAESIENDCILHVEDVKYVSILWSSGVMFSFVAALYNKILQISHRGHFRVTTWSQKLSLNCARRNVQNIILIGLASDGDDVNFSESLSLSWQRTENADDIDGHLTKNEAFIYLPQRSVYLSSSKMCEIVVRVNTLCVMTSGLNRVAGILQKIWLLSLHDRMNISICWSIGADIGNVGHLVQRWFLWTQRWVVTTLFISAKGGEFIENTVRLVVENDFELTCDDVIWCWWSVVLELRFACTRLGYWDTNILTCFDMSRWFLIRFEKEEIISRRYLTDGFYLFEGIMIKIFFDLRYVSVLATLSSTWRSSNSWKCREWCSFLLRYVDSDEGSAVLWFWKCPRVLPQFNCLLLTSMSERLRPSRWDEVSQNFGFDGRAGSLRHPAWQSWRLSNVLSLTIDGPCHEWESAAS